MANITAHVLPSGDGENMNVDHPTNDPRPFFKHTRTSNSIYQPTFHTKIQPLPPPKGEEVNNIARSRFHEANETKAHLSNPPKREEVNNIAKSQHRRSQRASKGHESDIGDRPVVSRSHTERPHPTPRTQSERATLFTYASQDKHGQHYRSCATEWGWMSTTLQMTQGHSSGTPEQATQLPTHLSHENPTPPPTSKQKGRRRTI